MCFGVSWLCWVLLFVVWCGLGLLIVFVVRLFLFWSYVFCWWFVVCFGLLVYCVIIAWLFDVGVLAFPVLGLCSLLFWVFDIWVARAFGFVCLLTLAFGCVGFDLLVWLRVLLGLCSPVVVWFLVCVCNILILCFGCFWVFAVLFWWFGFCVLVTFAVWCFGSFAFLVYGCLHGLCGFVLVVILLFVWIGVMLEM